MSRRRRQHGRRPRGAPVAARPPGEDAAWKLLLAAGGILAVGLAGFYSSLDGQFFFDDHRNILENPRVTRAWWRWDNLVALVRSDMRPVSVLSLAINYQLCGDRPWGYHAFNVAAHLLAGLLLFGIVRRTLRSPRLAPTFAPAALPLAALTAAVWVVHPLQTQAVTYVIQRMESLMGFFYLLTLYCAVRAMGPPRRRWERGAWSAGAVVACGLGMGSKQVMVTAPLVVFAYDAVFSPGSVGEKLRRRWAMYAGLGGTWLLLAALMWTGPAPVGAGFRGTAFTWLEYAATQFGVILHYLRLALLPVGLCLDYGWQKAQAWHEFVPQAVAVAVLLAATTWALWRRPPAGFLGLWFFLILAPTSSIMPVTDAAFEHRMYLPLAAVAAGAVCGAYALGRRLRLPAAAGVVAAVAVLGLLGWLTDRRNRQYHDVTGMWEDVVRNRPNWYRGLNSLGVAYEHAGRYEEAIEPHRKAVALEPGRPKHHKDLGHVLHKAGRHREALASLNQALRLNRRYAAAYVDRANVLSALGRLTEAEQDCRTALAINPRHATAHGLLGEVLAKQQRWAEAEAEYREVLRLDPDNPKAHEGVARALRGAGDLTGALAHCRDWLARRPQSARAHYHLGQALKRLGRLPEALIQYQQAIEIDPDLPQALNDLAWQLATHPDPNLRDGPRAVRLAQRACRAHGGKSPVFLDTLAAAYAEAGRFDEAVSAQGQATEILRRTGPEGPERTEQVRDYESRLKLYRLGRPYRSRPPGPPAPPASRPAPAGSQPAPGASHFPAPAPIMPA